MKRTVIPAILVALLSLTSCMRGDLYDNDDDKTSLLQISDLFSPSVNITSPVTDATNVSPIPVQINFSSPVTGFDISDLVVGNGNAANFVSISGSNYTADIIPSANGAVTLDIPAGAALTDPDAKPTKAAQQFSITYDTIVTIASVSIQSNNANMSWAKLGDTITVTLTQSEQLQAPTVTINGNAATVIPPGMFGTAWRATYVVTGADPEGPVTFTISGLLDLVGNAAADISATTDATAVTCDMSAPVIVTHIGRFPDDASVAIQGDDILLTITANEDIQPPVIEISGNAATRAGSGMNYTGDYIMGPADPEGTLAFSVTGIRDLAGNPASDINATAASDSSSVTYDRTLPSVDNITSSTPDGPYGSGATIDVTINFNEPVTITGGTASLTLDTGVVVAIPDITSTNTTSVSFVVGGGEYTTDLNVAAIDLNGATLVDAAGNSGTLSLPSSNLRNNKNISIDTTLPVINSIAASVPDGTYGTGAVVTMLVTFNKPVTLSAGGSVELALDSGGTAYISPFGPSVTATATYTVASGNNSGDCTVTNGGITLVSGTFEDGVGNTLDFTVPASNLAVNSDIVIDTIPPTIINITGTDASHGSGSTVTFTVNFSKNVSLSGGTIWLQLDSGGSAFVSPFANSSSATALYLVGPGENSADLTVNAGGISLTAGTLRDAPGNDTDLTEPAGNNLADNNTIVIDTTAPAAPWVTGYQSNNAVNTSYATTGDVITLSFSTENTGTTPTVTIAGAAVIPGGGPMNWTATHAVVAPDPDGPAGYSIAITDLAGNGNSAAGGGVTIDKTAPSAPSVASFLSDNGNTAYARNGNTITLSFTTGEAVPMPTVTIGSYAATVTDVGGAMSWQATYTLDGSEPDENAGYNIAIRDIAGNTNSANASGGVTIDNTAPAAPIVASYQSNNANTAYARNGNTITLTFTTSEPVITPSVMIGTHAATLADMGGSMSWQATYAVTGVDPDENAGYNIWVSDSAGNTNTAFMAGGVTIDNTAPSAPSVALFTSDNPDPAYARNGNTITLTFTTSESVATPAVTIGSYGATVVDLGGGTNWQSTYTLGGSEPDENAGYNIVITDFVGNTNSASAGSGIMIDNMAPSAPSVASFLSDNGNTAYARNGNTITLSFTTGEAVPMPTVTIGSYAATVTDVGGAMSWQATYTLDGSEPDENAGYNIAIRDIAGNTNSANASGGVTIDNTAPAAPIVASYQSNNANTAYARNGNTITLLFSTTESVTSPAVTIGTYGAGVTDLGGGTNWQATYVLDGSEPDGVVGYDIAISDTVGNTNSANASGGVTMDNTAPDAPTITGYYTNNATNNTFAHGTDTITVNFTTLEPMAIPSVLIGGNAATVTDLGGGTSWEASYILTGGEPEGIAGYSITLADAAGNSSNETGGVVTIDNTAPMINSVTALESTPGTYYAGGGPGAGFIIVKVNFSDAVTLIGGGSKRMEVTLNSGPTLYYNAVGPETTTVSYNYSVVAGNTTNGADLEATSITTFDGQIVDRAGNPMVDFTIGSPVMTGFYVDGVAPTYSVSISSNNSPGGTQYARVGDTITLTITANEPINKPLVTIAAHSEPTITVSGGGNTWVATYDMIGADGEGSVSSSVTNVTDTAGNPGSDTTGTTDGTAVEFSRTAPTVVSVTPVGPLNNAQTGDWVWVNIQFSKDMHTSFVPATWPEIRGLTTDPYIISDSAYWFDNRNWRARFFLLDQNDENLAAIYSIGDFPDVMGNIMSPNPTETFTVAVDTLTPTAYIATNYLNKSQFGFPVDVEVQFDTVMDTAWMGTATLTIPATGSVYTLTDNGWTNGDRTWNARFTFDDPDDANIDPTNATIDVSGFRDTGTNVMDPLARNIIVDTMQPTVDSVDSLTGDGTYGVGTPIDVTVNFSEPVTMSGDNLTVRFADFSTTANLGQFPLSTSVHATYTVASGDATASLNVYSPSGIDPGAGMLRDAAGNDANLAAFPPAGNNLADNSDIVIDAVQPVISYIWSSGAMSSYSAGQFVNVTLHFNESVNLNIGDLEIPLNTGGMAIATAPQSGNDISATYVVGAGESTPLLDVDPTITLTAGSLRDDAGNDANIITLPTGSNTLAVNDPISIDGVVPTITDVTADTTVDGAYGATSMIDVTIHFSEQVTMTGGPITANFDGGGSMQINDFALSNTATGTYTVAASQNSADLYISGFNLGGATIKDAAGNNADVNILAGNNLAFDRAIVIDTWAPTITSVTSLTSPGTYGESAAIDITVNYSEPVSLTGNDMAVILNAGPTIPVSPFAITASTAVNYTVAAGNNANPLTVNSITLVGGAILADAAGNQMIDFSIPINIDINLIVIDAVPPTIQSAVTMDIDPVDGRIDHYKITFNEEVDDSTFPGYANNNIGSPTTEWEVYGYGTSVYLAHGTAAPEFDTPNDSILYLKFDEMSFPDTGAKPDLSTTANPGITDLAGNVIAQVASGLNIESDGVKPRIESVVGAVGSDTVQVTFSEPVDATMGGGCSGTLSVSNLSYQNLFGGGATNFITDVTQDTNACDDATVVFRTDTAVSTNDIDVDGVMPPASNIYDAADNTAMPNTYTMMGLVQAMQLSFDTTSSGANVMTSESNFPLLVRLSDPGIIDAVRDGAPDLRFNDPDGTPLAYQIERWDKALDAAEVWVLVPQVLGNSKADYIIMYYNDKTDNTVPGRQEPGKVFGTGNQFAGVWHMNEADGMTILDSTANKNNSIARSTTRSANELIGGAQYFNNTTSVRIAHNATLNGNSGSGLTISVWAKHYEGAMSENQAIVTKQADTGSDYGYGFYTSTLDDYIYLRRDNTNFIYTNYTKMSDTIGTDWDYYVVRLNNGTTGSIYFNGTVQTLVDTTISPVLTNTSSVYFGRFNNLTTFDTFQGSLDEIRIENTQRSAAWIKLCYENQRIDQTLIMEPWFNISWQYRVKVTVPAANMSGTFNDFPLYIDLSKLPASFFTHVRSDGYDIRVTAGLQNLPIELVWINTTSGSEGGELYFRAPTVSSTKNISFYIYYGNASASTNPNSTDVWSNGFAGVWHLQSSSGTVDDSTANNNDGVLVGGNSGDFVAGAIGNGYNCAGIKYIQIPSSGTLNIAGPLTMSAWTVLNATSMLQSEMPLISTLDAASTIGYALAIFPASNVMEVRTGGGATQTGYSAGSLSAGTNYSACAKDAATGFLMRSNGSTASGTVSLPAVGLNEFNIGHTEYAMTNVVLVGIIDEVRFSSVARPADWMSNEYRNVYNSSFFTVGTEETQ